jgi:hypothetical protein
MSRNGEGVPHGGARSMGMYVVAYIYPVFMFIYQAIVPRVVEAEWTYCTVIMRHHKPLLDATYSGIKHLRVVPMNLARTVKNQMHPICGSKIQFHKMIATLDDYKFDWADLSASYMVFTLSFAPHMYTQLVREAVACMTRNCRGNAQAPRRTRHA